MSSKEVRQLIAEPDKLAFAAEYPTKSHELVEQFTDYDFLIALIAQRNTSYRDLFKRSRDPSRYRIVDSGIFEDPSSPISTEDLIRIALDLDADEVVALDLLLDCDGTIRELEKFMAISDDFPFKIQGVVQGKTLREWLRCYRYMVEHPRVDVIGISYCEVPIDLKDRMTALNLSDPDEAARLTLINILAGGIGLHWDVVENRVVNEELMHYGPITKPIHLLGLREPRAVKYYRLYPFIRSIDTSLPVQLGVEGKPFHLDSKKPAFKVNFAAELIRAENMLVANNCFRFMKFCRGIDESETWEIIDRLTSARLE